MVHTEKFPNRVACSSEEKIPKILNGEVWDPSPDSCFCDFLLVSLKVWFPPLDCEVMTCNNPWSIEEHMLQVLRVIEVHQVESLTQIN